MQPEAVNLSALKLRKIIDESKSLESPAALYLRRVCGFMPDSRETPFLRQYSLLPHYAHGGDFYAALIVKAINETTGNEAVEITYLTKDGELAPIERPKLLIGALAGASVPVKTHHEFGRFAPMYVFVRAEDAVKFLADADLGNVVAALRRSNILQLPVLQGPGDKRHVVLGRPAIVSEEAEAKWQALAWDLQDRGFRTSFEWTDL